ncbi:MAG TPA: hypothetical protein VF229_00285 [Burkholderiaceae bacterium]
MLKFALAAAIAFEWLSGPPVGSPLELAFAGLRLFMATLLCWMVLEALRALLKAIDSLDNRPAR